MVNCDHPNCNFEGPQDKKWFTIGDRGQTVLTSKSLMKFCSLSCADFARNLWEDKYK